MIPPLFPSKWQLPEIRLNLFFVPPRPNHFILSAPSAKNLFSMFSLGLEVYLSCTTPPKWQQQPVLRWKRSGSPSAASVSRTTAVNKCRSCTECQPGADSNPVIRCIGPAIIGGAAAADAPKRDLRRRESSVQCSSNRWAVRALLELLPRWQVGGEFLVCCCRRPLRTS